MVPNLHRIADFLVPKSIENVNFLVSKLARLGFMKFKFFDTSVIKATGVAWKELKGGFGINFDTSVNKRIYKPWRENKPQDASNFSALGV